MTETHRTNLLTACAYAREFIKLSDAEIRGAGGAMIAAREDAQHQLAAALRNLTPPSPDRNDFDTMDWGEAKEAGPLEVYNPDIHKLSTEPYPHIDSDRHRGPSDWDRECQESRRLNR